VSCRQASDAPADDDDAFHSNLVLPELI